MRTHARPKWATGFPLLIAAVLVAAGASTARADPIRITSGDVVQYGDFSSSSISMAGPGFSMAVAGGYHSGAPMPDYRPGDVADLSTIVGVGGFGGASINGNPAGDAEDAFLVTFGGGFRVFAEPFVVPPDGSLQTHFTMAGEISAFPRHGGPPFFTVEVVGSGRMSISPLGPNPPGRTVQTFTFEAPAAVPEPATVFLLGAGLMALAGRRAAAM